MDAIPEHHSGDEPDLVLWEPEETARFLESVDGDRFAALHELAAYAGMRRAELCGLRWNDIAEGGASLVIRQTLPTARRLLFHACDEFPKDGDVRAQRFAPLGGQGDPCRPMT
jgi:integrase